MLFPCDISTYKFSPPKARFLFCILFCLAVKCYSQKLFRATYRYSFVETENDVLKNTPYKDSLDAFYKDAAKQPGKHSVTFTFTANDTDVTKSEIFKKKSRTAKRDLNFVFYCTPSRLVSTVEEKQTNNYGIKTVSKLQSKAYNVTEFEKNLISFNLLVNNKIQTKCTVIDTSQLHFKQTKRTRKINGRVCHEYISTKEEYNYISIWIDKYLPWYINPELYSKDFNGGIAEVSYKDKDKMTLILVENISKIEDYTVECSLNLVSDTTNLINRMRKSFIPDL